LLPVGSTTAMVPRLREQTGTSVACWASATDGAARRQAARAAGRVRVMGGSGEQGGAFIPWQTRLAGRRGQRAPVAATRRSRRGVGNAGRRPHNPPMEIKRSEERRVGKECRVRWRMYF